MHLRMNLNHLSKQELITNTEALVSQERRITIEVLWHLHEIERRKLYAELGYSSLFSYCIEALKYSEAQAFRRISAMRLLKQAPELEAKLNDGALSVATICQVQALKISISQKKEILKEVEGKSKRETERYLLKIAPRPIEEERVKPISATHTRIEFNADEELMKKLDELKNMLAHKMPNASVAELVRYLVDESLKKSSAEPKVVLSPAKVRKNVNTRYIPETIKQHVWQRDHGQCSYIHYETQKRCDSQYALEYDHILPHALGGETTIDNLRMLCRSHNQFLAMQTFGNRNKIKKSAKCGT